MITGAHRTWLDPSGHDKAPVDTPRRAMGHLLGNGVRFGIVHDVMAAGEGIETMLSLRSALPTMPLVAALSANHLAALLFPATLRRLYVAQDRDPAGDAVTATLTERARAPGSSRLSSRRHSATSTASAPRPRRSPGGFESSSSRRMSPDPAQPRRPR
jgi:hypothetical protein